ncbi:hypothetical protein [Maricaulis sp. MIT060901]|uniref:hypothetical protein n=1 Tax=Maricaulis sp. MIT060901 TaxID=3096993 RepID=UPI00399A61B4
MRKSISLATLAILAFSASPALAQSSDSLAWQTGLSIEENDETVRWRFSTEQIDLSGTTVFGDFSDSAEVSALTGEIEIHPFGDEFYLSAGARQSFDTDAPDWAVSESEFDYDLIPLAQLSEIEGSNRLAELTRYFGAGVTVRTINAWDLTLEGGAYFGDSRADQMEIFDPETGETRVLLDDLDRVDREAVGDTHARSVRPVGHFVLRRRF